MQCIVRRRSSLEKCRSQAKHWFRYKMAKLSFFILPHVPSGFATPSTTHVKYSIVIIYYNGHATRVGNSNGKKIGDSSKSVGTRVVFGTTPFETQLYVYMYNHIG